VNILFWNINRKNPVNCLQELLAENSVDFLVLAEYPYNIEDLCQHVNTTLRTQYKAIPNISGSSIQGLINYKYDVKLLTEDSHHRLIIISTTDYELIAAMVHARSKQQTTPATQRIGLSIIYNDIANHENELNCKNTIAIGDFNVSPFEDIYVSASGMHAIPFPDAVQKENRVILGQSYQKFFNPTRRLLGKNNAPYSTYYYNNSGEDCNYYWYMFDQVIIRPTLMNAFDEESLKIITGTSNYSLLTKNNTPDKTLYSDHLPLFCRLKEDLI